MDAASLEQSYSIAIPCAIICELTSAIQCDNVVKFNSESKKLLLLYPHLDIVHSKISISIKSFLTFAILQGKENIVRYLLTDCDGLSRIEPHTKSAVHYAAQAGRIEMFDMLIQDFKLDKAATSRNGNNGTKQ